MTTQAELDTIAATLEAFHNDICAELTAAVAEHKAAAEAAGVTLDTSRLDAVTAALTADDAAWKAALPPAEAPGGRTDTVAAGAAPVASGPAPEADPGAPVAEPAAGSGGEPTAG